MTPKTSFPPWRSLGDAALAVLETAAPEAKARLSKQGYEAWQSGVLTPDGPEYVPDRPARPVRPELRAPRDMPRRRRAGSVATRIALLHAVAHIELNAIDLAWDLVARFAANMPSGFADDWTRVAADEGRHFLMLQARLASLGSAYGNLPAHDGLWEAALRTEKDLAARLAVVPMVLEARGLDVTPAMIERLESAGDWESANVLTTILEEEVAHVAAGRRWFDYLCRLRQEAPAEAFRRYVLAYYGDCLRPPFNKKARCLAGLEADFYEPLAAKYQKSS